MLELIFTDRITERKRWEEVMDIQEVIIFDCMETLIDMHELPGEREYAFWAYAGSGVEHYWEGFEEFYGSFQTMRKTLSERVPYHKEYDIRERFGFIIGEKIGTERIEETNLVIGKLLKNFWVRYKDRCYVSSDVIHTLECISDKYRLGVISNFLVRDGVEELLKKNGIYNYFDFVVTSVNVGWRKPHPLIYSNSLEKAGASADRVLFIGDDYTNDFITPRQLGYQALLYDRNNNYPEIDSSFSYFKELPQILNK